MRSVPKRIVPVGAGPTPAPEEARAGERIVGVDDTLVGLPLVDGIAAPIPTSSSPRRRPTRSTSRAREARPTRRSTSSPTAPSERRARDRRHRPAHRPARRGTAGDRPDRGERQAVARAVAGAPPSRCSSTPATSRRSRATACSATSSSPHGTNVAGANPESGPFPTRPPAPARSGRLPRDLGQRHDAEAAAPRAGEAAAGGEIRPRRRDPPEATIAGPSLGDALATVAKILHPNERRQARRLARARRRARGAELRLPLQLRQAAADELYR